MLITCGIICDEPSSADLKSVILLLFFADYLLVRLTRCHNKGKCIYGGAQKSMISKFEKIFKMYHGSVLIMVTYPVNGVLIYGNGCSSVSAPLYCVALGVFNFTPVDLFVQISHQFLLKHSAMVALLHKSCSFL